MSLFYTYKLVQYYTTGYNTSSLIPVPLTDEFLVAILW